jgi:Protein of unknown function (DUF3179)
MATRRVLLGCLLVGGVWLLGYGVRLAAGDTASEMHTVLPKDAIPAILRPILLPALHAQVAPDAAMIGVVFNGEAHAYAAVLLNAHEIVNDVVGGEPVATTW